MLPVMIVAMGLVQLLAPLGLAYWMRRRFQVDWRLLGIGLLVYLGYQVVQLPVFQALEGSDAYSSLGEVLPQFTLILILSGVSALIEQGLTAGGFWFVRKNIAKWEQGAALALGHAGAGSLLIGLLQLVNFAIVASATAAGPQTIAGSSGQGAQNVQSYLEFYWSQPWYLPLAGMLQSLALLVAQWSQGMMVWLAFTRRAWMWAAAAVLWQTATSGALLASTAKLDDLANDLVYVLVMGLNAGIFYLLYRKNREINPTG